MTLQTSKWDEDDFGNRCTPQDSYDGVVSEVKPTGVHDLLIQLLRAGRDA